MIKCIFPFICIILILSGGKCGYSEPETIEKDIKALDLSLDACLRMTLENNIDILAGKYNVEIAKKGIDKARAEFIPYATFQLNANEFTTPAYTELAGALTNDQKNVTGNAGIEQKIGTGGEYFLQFNTLRNSSNSSFQFLNPYYQSDVTLTFIQPLAKNFGSSSTNYYINLSKSDLIIKKYELTDEICKSLSEAERAYWSLVYASKKLEIKKESLRLAKELLEMNKAKNTAGEIADIELSQAKLGVIGKKDELVDAITEYKLAEDDVRIKMGAGLGEDIWNNQINPSDNPLEEKKEFSITECFNKVLLNKGDYRILEEEIKKDDTRIRWYKNQLLPEVNLKSILGYNGLSNSYPGDLSMLRKGEFYTWQIGIEVKVPLEEELSSSDYRASLLNHEKLLKEKNKLEQEIYSKLRENIRNIDSNYEKIIVLEESDELAREELEAGKEKFKLGITNTYQILELIDKLAEAKIKELESIVNYNKSLAELKRLTGIYLEENNISIKNDDSQSQPSIIKNY